MNEKRVIAVDFDDVVVQTGMHFLEYSFKKYGQNVHPKHLYEPTFEAWGIDADEFLQRVTDFHSSEQRQNLRVVNGVVDALSRLSKVAELHVVTGRPPSLASTTHEVIEMYFPNIFTSVNFTNVFSMIPTSKSDICLQLSVDYLIDDHIGHATDVAGAGIDVLLFGNYPWNQVETLPERVRRVSGWDEVLRIVEAE